MTGRDIHRLDAHFSAHGRPHHLSTVDEWAPRALFVWHWLVVAHQNALSHPNAGPVEQHAHVAGNAHAPGVGNALSVKEEQVGPPFGRNIAPGRLDGRPLADGEQARNVRKVHGHLPNGVVNELQFRVHEYCDDGDGLSVGVPGVHTSHEPHRRRKVILQHEVLAQRLLPADGFLWRQVPLGTIFPAWQKETPLFWCWGGRAR